MFVLLNFRYFKKNVAQKTIKTFKRMAENSNICLLYSLLRVRERCDILPKCISENLAVKVKHVAMQWAHKMIRKKIRGENRYKFKLPDARKISISHSQQHP